MSDLPDDLWIKICGDNAKLKTHKLKKKKTEKIKKKRISYLPDDLWRKILDMGIENSKLTYKDLCSISITCKRLYRLSSEDSLWSHLLSSNVSSFRWVLLWNEPIFSVSTSAKSQYRIRLKRDRARERTLEKRRREILELHMLWSWPFEFWSRPFEFRERRVQRRAVLEQGNLVDILSAKIQEIELAEEIKERKVTAAYLFNSTKANSKGFERVPDKNYPRERRSKAFTKQTKRHR